MWTTPFAVAPGPRGGSGKYRRDASCVAGPGQGAAPCALNYWALRWRRVAKLLPRTLPPESLDSRPLQAHKSRPNYTSAKRARTEPLLSHSKICAL